ncbi:DUF2087 domain-containing protein [Vagococcus elongatus]|uniref:DUF2087 domain-containing protein n=1 Tax=Vagococcus elongatus TaxID=180344 RepID=A0A430ARM0_9ENTE|nr:DUF2087 domain-containing protein [Vagococcus elongatus]RSU10702.1 hypothetical protein CBF29_08940 [Vagococcus elongatus]
MTKHLVNQIEQLSNGYDYRNESYFCNYCESIFKEEMIYPLDEELLTAKGAMKHHLLTEHGGNFFALMEKDHKTFGLTEVQLAMLSCFYQNISDNDMAKMFNITPATVRNHRFKLNEKKNQAIHFLSLVSIIDKSLEEGKLGIQSFDQRFNITKHDREKALKNFIDPETKRITIIPRKEKTKIILLQYLITALPNKTFSEQEINLFLKKYVDDFASIRRYLVDYGLLARTKDGKIYWKI